MYSFAVNKYLYPVASVGFLFSLNNDARNHELEKKKDVPQGLIGKKKIPLLNIRGLQEQRITLRFSKRQDSM